MHKNLILATDSYKATHWLQYPPGTTHVYSYLESRSENDKTLFFGLQYYLQEYLKGSRITLDDVTEAKEFYQNVFGNTKYFNESGWMRIVYIHNGIIPIKIQAVPEGMVIDTQNVLMTIENTDPELPWVVQFVETLLMKIWYPITVATYSKNIKTLLNTYAQKTGGSVSPFHLNDFGYRGVSSEESAAIGGAAHLISFSGTDNQAGILFAQKYYDASPTVGGSVMASEHSTTTSWGETGEIDALESFLDQAIGIVSVVADSYDTEKFARDYIGGTFRDRIMNGNTRVVVRPDSGDPVEQVRMLLTILEEKFGTDTNALGFKLLHPNVGIIYGDFMSIEYIEKISELMVEMGFAVDGRNVVFGMGGQLLQKCDRDTYKFALKASAIRIDNGPWQDVFKNPKSQSSKASKKGRLDLEYDSEIGKFKTVREERSDHQQDWLQTVFHNGRLYNNQNFQNVRIMQESLDKLGEVHRQTNQQF